MTDLLLYDFEQSDRGLIKAGLLGTKISVIPLEELAEEISKVLEQAIFYNGLNREKKKQDDVDMLKLMVIKDCQKYFHMMSKEEVVAAIENGYRGIYGKVMGISPKDVFIWIKTYKENPLRLDEKKLLESNSGDDFNEPPSEEDEMAMALYNLNTAWNKFKAEGAFTDHGNVIYNLLHLNKKISLTEEDRIRFKQIAKSRLLTYNMPEKHIGNEVKMKEAINMCNDIKNGNANNRVVAEAKRLALNEFFTKLANDGKEIWDLFND